MNVKNLFGRATAPGGRDTGSVRRLMVGWLGAVGLLVACSAHGSAPARLSAPSARVQTPTASHESAKPPSVARTTRSARPSASDPDAGEALIARVRWTKTDKGRQLQVFPTRAGRTDQVSTASARAWREILGDARNAGSPGMHDQFLCHWNFARVVEPNKPSWNLEPWRPVVGYRATVAALCNPGGSES